MLEQNMEYLKKLRHTQVILLHLSQLKPIMLEHTQPTVKEQVMETLLP